MEQLPETIQDWLNAAVRDAERRGVPQLKPLLESLARSTAALRSADWNDTIAPRSFATDGQASTLGGQSGADRTR